MIAAAPSRWPVVFPLAPVAEIAVAEVVGPRRVGEQRDDAVLRPALGAGLLRHGRLRRNEPRLAGEQLLHHPLLELAGLVAPGFERRQLGVHVGEDARRWRFVQRRTAMRIGSFRHACFARFLTCMPLFPCCGRDRAFSASEVSKCENTSAAWSHLVWSNRHAQADLVHKRSGCRGQHSRTRRQDPDVFESAHEIRRLATD